MTSATREARCDCCDLPVSSCGKAAEDAQRLQLEMWRRYLCKIGWFRSQFGGACHKCGTDFPAGACIRSDGHARHGAHSKYLGECCAPALPDSGSK